MSWNNEELPYLAGNLILARLAKNRDNTIIRPYGGFASDSKFYALGRVLEDKGIVHRDGDGIFRTFWNFFKRMESDEKPGVKVSARWDGGNAELVSDREGYIHLDQAHGLPERGKANEWIDVHYVLAGDVSPVATQVFRPGKGAEFGLITDMDDTVIHTGVASRFKWRLLVNSALRHPFNRRPLEGVKDFYQTLWRGKSGRAENPVFYVSNSPWNLHSYLATFLVHQGFPKGPLILRDIGAKPVAHSPDGGSKYGRVKEILEAFPAMKFVLFGDSAEVDTDIYLRLAREFPEQVHSIFIRSVKNRKRMRRVAALIEANQDVHVKLIRDSGEGLAFAKKVGLV